LVYNGADSSRALTAKREENRSEKKGTRKGTRNSKTRATLLRTPKERHRAGPKDTEGESRYRKTTGRADLSKNQPLTQLNGAKRKTTPKKLEKRKSKKGSPEAVRTKGKSL